MLCNFNIAAGMDVSYAVDCGYPLYNQASSESTVGRMTYVHPC